MESIKKKIKNFIDNKTGERTLCYEIIPHDIECISFDIFDTLIVRDVTCPKNVFSLLERENGIKNFTNLRIEAEQKARLIKQGHEVNLFEIYSCIPQIEISQISNYCNKEFEMELSICQPNQAILNFYNKCVKNKRVVLTSDMYLSSDQLRIILNKCQIWGFEKLFVSSEIDFCKSNGTLYNYVAQNIGVNKNKIIHIGNDYKTDYLMAIKNGLRAIKIPTNRNNILVKREHYKKFNKEENFSFQNLRSFINNHTPIIMNDNDFYYKFGYENFGILLWGFCRWLQKQFTIDGIEQALFLARDGYIIKKAYDMLDLDKIVPSGYLEMSRRSIRVPVIFSDELSYCDMLCYIPLLGIVTIEQLFDGWGLDLDNYHNLINEYELNANMKFTRKQIEHDHRIRNLYERLIQDITKNANEEKKLLFSYINQFDLNKKTAIIDIGYNGTIQKELITLLNSKSIYNNIKGYYLMLGRNARTNSEKCDFQAKGYIFDHMNHQDDPCEVLPYTGMFETLFLEQYGSIKRYKKGHDGVVADRYEFEYSDNNLLGINEHEKVNILQKGALDFVSEYDKSPLSKQIDLSSKVVFAFLNDKFCHPNKNLILHFGKFRFFDMGNTSLLAYPKHSLKAYIAHPTEFIHDYYESRWRVGFVKAVFKINIPLIEILRFRKRIYQVFGRLFTKV